MSSIAYAGLLVKAAPFNYNKLKIFISIISLVALQTTWADFVFTVALENFENIFGATALENYPALRGLKKRVHEISAIADWLSRRPHSEF